MILTVPRVVDGPVPLSSEQVYQAYAQKVAGWVSRLAGPRADVEDLVQEVFLRVHRGLPSFRGDCQVGTWVYSITENVVRARRQRERVRRWFGSAVDPETVQAASLSPTPSEDLERRQSAARLYEALDALPEKYRTLFILFEVEGLSGEEIAELTGTKLATVWVRLTRARARLFARLADEDKRGRRGLPA
jgi:RNA polymerase sigma-70 factor (ECF subfamily)